MLHSTAQQRREKNYTLPIVRHCIFSVNAFLERKKRSALFPKRLAPTLAGSEKVAVKKKPREIQTAKAYVSGRRVENFHATCT